MESVGTDLQSVGMIGETNLAPHAARPQESLGGVRSHMPLVWISVAAVVVSLGIYFGLQWSVSNQADDLVEHIQQTQASSQP